jgi:DNA gyrase subunit A
LILIRTVHGDEDIIIITNLGTTLRTSLTQINETSRNTIGVKVMTLRDKETISSCSILPSASEYEATKPAVEETVSDALKEEEKEDDDKAMKELLSRAQNENPGDDGE